MKIAKYEFWIVILLNYIAIKYYIISDDAYKIFIYLNQTEKYSQGFIKFVFKLIIKLIIKLTVNLISE